MDPKQFDVWQREQYRKSMDTILVYNPTEEDYICYWDKYPHVIPSSLKDMGFGAGKMQLVRYIADKYMKEMKDEIINKKSDDLVERAKEERMRKGLSSDPGEINIQLLNTLPRTNNEKEIEEAYGFLYCGLVREFGLYDEPEKKEETVLDQRSPEEKILEKAEKGLLIKKETEKKVISEPSNNASAPAKSQIIPDPIK